MIRSGLTYPVIYRSSLGDGYVRVRDSGLVTAVAQFLYDEAALLDEWRLDEWLALVDPEAGKYLVPNPEDQSDNPSTTLHLVNDSVTTLAGRVGPARSRSKHAARGEEARRAAARAARSPTCACAARGARDLLSRSSVFDVTRVRGGVMDRYAGVYEHQLLPGGNPDTPWLIGRRRVLIDHSIESAGGQVSILL